MISENTAAASSSRLAGSLSAASSGVSASVVATVVAIINFTLHLPSLPRPLRLLHDELIDHARHALGAAGDRRRSRLGRARRHGARQRDHVIVRLDVDVAPFEQRLVGRTSPSPSS